MRCPGAIVRAVPLPAVIVAATLVVHRLPVLPGTALADAMLAAGLLALLIARAPRHHGWRLFAVMLAASGWTIGQAERGMAQRLGVAQEGRDYTVVGYVVSMPVDTDRGSRFVFAVESCADAGDDCPDRRRVRLSWHRFGDSDGEATRRDSVGAPEGKPQPGERWRLHVRLKRVHALHNPNAFDAELRALEEGIAANGYVRSARSAEAPNERIEGRDRSVGVLFERARTTLREAMRRALAEARADSAGVLVALVVGDQNAIPAYWWEVFNRTGIGHLMSISGLHITMLAGISVVITRRMLRTRIVASSGLLLVASAQRLSWLAGVVSAFVYAGIAGWGIPAQRTCWMLAVAGVSLLSGRTRSIARVLALASGVVCVLDPWAALSAGFWLSFASVAAIALFAAGGRKRSTHAARTRLQRTRALLVEAVRTQWAASVALVPLGALFFASVSLIGPLANAFAIPLVSVVITPLAIGAASLLPWLPWVGSLLLALAAHATGWLLDALSTLSDSPWAAAVIATPSTTVLVVSVVAVALLLAPFPLPARAFAFAGLLPLLGGAAHLPPDGAIRVVALDVGQGMAVLVETSRRRLLYDTGPLYGGDSEAGARVIVPYLRSRGIDRLDALVVSHLDSDHSGGTASVLRNVPVDWIAGSLPPEHPARDAGRPFHDCRRGHGWDWEDVRFEFLHPGPEKPRGVRSATNASSCVLRIESPAARIVLAGDIEAGQERALVQRHGASGLRADLLLAPHHGSSSSSSQVFLDAVAPRHVIVQAGYRNRFRHPSSKVVERYRAAGIEMLRSDRDGAITIDYAPGREPRIARSRIDDRRYWRIRVDDADARPVGVTAPSILRPSSRPRRAPDRPRASTGTPRVRPAARVSRIPATAASRRPAGVSLRPPSGRSRRRAHRSAARRAESAPSPGRSRCR